MIALTVLVELNKVLQSGALTPVLLIILTEIRHRLLSLLCGCQLPELLPIGMRGLLQGVIVHKLESETSVEAVRKIKEPFEKVSRAQLAAQAPGEAYAVFSETSAPELRNKALRLVILPPCSMPAGATVSTVPEDE